MQCVSRFGSVEEGVCLFWKSNPHSVAVGSLVGESEDHGQNLSQMSARAAAPAAMRQAMAPPRVRMKRFSITSPPTVPSARYARLV